MIHAVFLKMEKSVGLGLGARCLAIHVGIYYQRIPSFNRQKNWDIMPKFIMVATEEAA
jgi:hypothetical protein